jgi:hypothetical protein
MTQHLQASYRELTPTRRGERNGRYFRNLITPAGKIERLEVPRDREGEFVTEVFEGTCTPRWKNVRPVLPRLAEGKRHPASRIGESLEGKRYLYIVLDLLTSVGYCSVSRLPRVEVAE